MVSVQHLSMHFGARLLFDDVNVNLQQNKRYGLVGANGTGKSTFLHLLSGQETPSLGEIQIAKQSTVGWLKQDHFKYENDIIVDVVLQGKQDLWEAMQEKEQLLSLPEIDEKTGYRLAKLEEIIIHHNGYTAESFAKTLLVGLGIEQSYHEKPLSALSGGYKLRVLLAKVLFLEPDILLLDEPTNHLDIMSISWLENYLKTEFKGVLIFISHDQDFLNNLSTHILDVDYGEIREYVGNYDRFMKEKMLVAEQKLSELKYLENKIAHMKVFVERFRASASRSKQALSREKQIERLELPDIKKSSRIAPKFTFTQKRPSGKMALKIEGVSKSFNNKVVLKNVRININRGEKVAIIGHNGMGKSTLLKIMMGQYTADAGEYTWGHESHVSYFAQDHHELLNENIKVYDWLLEKSSHEITSESIRKALGQMLFTQDDVYKDILTLSGGEAARLLFSDMILKRGNILVLDEPTNHLDLETRETLADGLHRFEGTVIVVSHDRHFVSKVATRILALTEKGITDFQGTYKEYLTRFGDDYLNRTWLLSQ